MNNTVKCHKCGAEIEISDALKHKIEEQLTASLEAKYKIESEEATKKAVEEASKKTNAELSEEKERNKKQSEDLSKLLDEIKELRNRDRDREIEMKKKLLEEEEKIRRETREKTIEERDLKDREKDKTIEDLKKALDEAQKRASQGSQQLQGETLELQLEERLRAEFPQDIITEVKKGQRGADVLQDVVDKLGRKCGSILWESKNAQWSEPWINKLKEDQRQAKADLAVLVSVNLPDGAKDVYYQNGVWIVGMSGYISLALALRFNLVSVYHERQSSEGKDEKMKVLYEYLTGTEFKHRVEGIVESFSNLQDELEREKRWFNAKWARQEKEIRKVVDHTHGMYGDLQGVIGKSLPEIKSLSLDSGEDTEEPSEYPKNS